ncbi:hypothetical protein [Dokdonia sp. Dokd-P16]|uniref:hypothetical protein n=1 Tax=Dokdonia sp. Dokd-P16 TaxID=2173169 RepID=UPI0013A56794|nr:hypothetical protein [Dokdonia sp. Dokd-P16]
MLLTRPRAIYNAAFKNIAPITVGKLNEKMITSKEARMETIIKANREMGNPKMIARFLIFL